MPGVVLLDKVKVATVEDFWSYMQDIIDSVTEEQMIYDTITMLLEFGYSIRQESNCDERGRWYMYANDQYNWTARCEGRKVDNKPGEELCA